MSEQHDEHLGVTVIEGLPGVEAIRRSIDVLIGLLLIMIGASVATSDRLSTSPNLVIGRDDTLIPLAVLFAFAAVYYWGAATLDVGFSWKTFLWQLLLVVCWVLLLPMNDLAVYLVFPLFFLFLSTMPDYRGVTAVIGATAVAIANQYPAFTAGGVLGPVLAALVTIAIFFAFRRLWLAHTEREALVQELLATRHQLVTTERQAGMVAERQRIAHEIHDTLAQGLSSIQMLLHMAEQDVANSADAEATKKIRLARATAADNLSEARAMIGALQPAALDEVPLESALQRIAESTAEVEVGVAVDGVPVKLPMRIEATLLRIAQGAMGNVAKHAQATRAQMTLTFEPEEVRLDVVDNGIGFDPAEVESKPAGLGHIGLAAMRSRAREAGGSFEVESARNEGTALSVALPLLESAR